MPRVGKTSSKKRSEAEQLLLNFKKLYIPALNHLLGVVKGNDAKKKVIAKSLKWQPMFDSYHPTVSDRVKRLPSTQHFTETLGKLYAAIDTSSAALSKLLFTLEDQIGRMEQHSTGASMYQDYLDAYNYYTRYRSLLSRFQRELAALETPPREEDFIKAIWEDPRNIPRQIKTLIQLKDPIYRHRQVKKKAMERVGPSAERVIPTKADEEAVEREFHRMSLEAREKINAYLREQDADFLLLQQGPLRRIYREGRGVNPYFQRYFGPFIDYLCDPKPFFRLAVCENCGSVYVRKPKDNGWYCSKQCAREARKRRQITKNRSSKSL